MDSKYSGHCLCGDISYSADAEPVFTGNCHCKDCQRASGSAFVAAMIFPEDRVVVQGEAKYFESKADSGNIHKRGFCPNCGSRMFAKFSAMPGMLGVAAGTLNDSSSYSPKLDFFVASAAVWDHMDPQLPKKQGAPRA
ncbi:MAG: GFA family protein [Pseudomonadota bacterium]